MGLIKGLKGINAHVEAEDAKFAGKGDGDSVKAKWFKIADKETVKVLFLQELDPDSENYSQKNDLGFIAVEHSNPKNFRRKAVCTVDDEGVCWACEQHNKDWKAGWKQKNKLYINVLVDDGKNEPFVAILSQGMGPKSVTPALIEYAGDGSITDKWYKVKRTGAGQTDTSYLLMPSIASKLSVEDYELFDLEKALYSVSYAQQEAHYMDGEATEEAVENKPAWEEKSSSSGDTEW